MFSLGHFHASFGHRKRSFVLRITASCSYLINTPCTLSHFKCDKCWFVPLFTLQVFLRLPRDPNMLCEFGSYVSSLPHGTCHKATAMNEVWKTNHRVNVTFIVVWINGWFLYFVQKGDSIYELEPTRFLFLGRRRCWKNGSIISIK